LPANAAEMREPLAAALIKVKNGEATLVDVREAGEVKSGALEKAVWLPTSEIKAKGAKYAEVMKTLGKDKPVYVYCASGVRSERFADQLDAEGYKASSLGGIDELIAAGFVKGPAPQP
jgi:rhodanese-related sulfurtransferase